mgnify:CR=1 FL=1
MPNTFLNTGRTVRATSKPVNNVNQVSNNPVNQTQVANQPVQNTQTQAQQANSAINPITIPIQIQPQIASTAPVQNSANNVQTLQANNIQQANAAPTPQAYNANNTSNNVIDFNQIYSSYQNQYGNTNQTTNNTNISGIKKTSIGSTIVTPTTSNLNSVQGQYQSAYADSINGLISEMLAQVSNGFQYDPTTDTSLQIASEYAANSTLQSLAGSGVLNSSATAERVARVVSELIPQYEQLAYTRWTDSLNQLANTAQLVMNYDTQQFEYWKDAKDREFQDKQFEYQKQQHELENAWKRVDELGYVDNEASAILGVPVGTLSGEARLAKEEREFELQKMREQLEIQRANDEALYKLRAELDKEYASYTHQLDKDMANYNQQLDQQNIEYEYQLAEKYGTSSSQSNNYTSLSTYQDIINNRWAEKDPITEQYTISDNDSVYNYLVSEYAAGRMSASDLANLTAMYGVTVPDSSNNINKFQSAQNLIRNLRSWSGGGRSNG